MPSSPRIAPEIGEPMTPAITPPVANMATVRARSLAGNQ